jgi:8-oxo-dGTP pyrophosphatase MutT (NUDIX family)
MMQLPTPDHIARIISSQNRTNLSLPFRNKAAVMIPLIRCDRPGDYDLLLTLRADTVEHHKGQVSFPGGAADTADTDEIATALRETEEEVGIPPSDIRILGTLNAIAASSHFHITPVVGLLDHPPHLTLQPSEVAEVFYVPLSFFSDPANETAETRLIERLLRKVYFYRYGGHTIWGITAVIIRQFLQLLTPGTHAEKAG